MSVQRIVLALLAVALIAAPATGQVVQIDLAGEWAARSGFEDQPHRVPGPELGDYTGIPLNDAARLKARTWDASVLSQPERQAQPHPAPYSMRGPGPNFRMNKVVDPRTFALVAYQLTGLFGNADRTIWLDGRAHPPELAEHTWNGFSTGEWIGNALKVTTTHIKAGTVQRNGVPTSVHARMTEFFLRHGDTLTLATIVEDPIYFEEPFVRTSNFVWNPAQTQARPGPFEIVDEVAGQSKGWVPSHPIGALHDEFARRFNLPYEATQGGSATLYPEYMARLGTLPVAPSPSAARLRPSATPPAPRRSRTEFDVLPVRDGLYLLAGPSGNSTVHVSEDGVLLIDTGAGAETEKLAAAIKRLTDQSLTYIINTSSAPGKIGGNAALSQAGRDPGGNAPGNFGFRIGVAPIIAHESVLRRISAPTGSQPAMPFAAWPTSTYFTEKKTMFFGEEPIEIHAQPGGHTDGDSIVFFRRADVISAGDLFMIDRYPAIDLTRGGSIQGTIDGLNRIIDIAIPRFNQQGGTLIIPGHGRLCNESDVVEYRDMVTIVRDRIRAMVARGLTLEQVKAANPTLDYDGVYGSPDAFIEAVYRGVSRR